MFRTLIKVEEYFSVLLFGCSGRHIAAEATVMSDYCFAVKIGYTKELERE